MKYCSKQSVSSGRTLHYIKLFESFNDFSNIKSDITDIFVELIDEGFRVSFRPNYGFSKHDGAPDERDNDVFIQHFKEGNFSICLRKERYKGDIHFKISDIYEQTMMLVDFVESVGINSKVSFKSITKNKRGMSYNKKMTLPKLESFVKENKPVSSIEIIFESNN